VDQALPGFRAPRGVQTRLVGGIDEVDGRVRHLQGRNRHAKPA